jgi:hypothetical protein
VGMPYFLVEVDWLGRRFHALVAGNASAAY